MVTSIKPIPESRNARQGTTQQRVFFILIAVVIVLASLAMAKANGILIPAQPSPLIVDNTIYLDSLTLEQKIAQMVVVAGGRHNLAAWKKMQLGGVHLFAMKNESIFRETIDSFQENMAIPFFVTVDLEGCFNPFASFKEFKAASEVAKEGDAFEKGSEEGRFLSSLGITVNFAPVVDLQDHIWNCRSFLGNETTIAGLAEAYVLGLQKEGVMATAKHYPGKTLVVRDPHKFIVAADISTADLYPYRELSSSVDGIMVSHLIVSGALNSQGVPAVASPAAIQLLRENFNGLIISDEINMLGLKNFYKAPKEMYLAVFNAGNDLILNFNEDPNEIHQVIGIIVAAVEEGVISEERIDASVRKILEAKGFTVV